MKRQCKTTQNMYYILNDTFYMFRCLHIHTRDDNDNFPEDIHVVWWYEYIKRETT